MRAKSLIFFTLLTGLSFAIVEGANDFQFDADDDLGPPNHGNSSGNFLWWASIKNSAGAVAGSYLLRKLKKLVSEHPIESMIFAIIVGIITNENKENIFEGIRKLRNSAYRVMGFRFKIDKESKKDEQEKEIKFVEWANLDNSKTQDSGKIFVLDS